MEYFLSYEEKECVMDLSVPCISLTLCVKSVVFWGLFNAFCKWAAFVVGKAYFSDFDVQKCYFPESFPLEPQRGSAKEWTRRVVNVEEDELEAFLKFRGVAFTELGLQQKRDLAACEALKYRNELYEENLLFYYEEHFLHGRKTPYPTMPRTWNASSFFGEMGPAVQLIWTGQFSFSLHHLCGGLVALYCLQVDINYARWLCYIDIGYNIIEVILMLMSYLLSFDCSLSSGPRRMDTSKGDYTMAGFFIVISFHHIGAVSMEFLALLGLTDPVLIAEGALAMMGTTGMLLFMSNLTDFMPIRENKRARFLFTSFVSAVMMYERGILWIYKFVPGLLQDTYMKSGIPMTLVAAVGLVMFSNVNYQMLVHFKKKTQKTYEEMTEAQTGKITRKLL